LACQKGRVVRVCDTLVGPQPRRLRLLSLFDNDLSRPPAARHQFIP
jgi:hypothetical protein